MSTDGSRQSRNPAVTSGRRANSGPTHASDKGQERASRAWKNVTDVANSPANTQERYLALARKLPSYLQVSGLGQTMAFLFAKGKGKRDNEHAMLFEHLGEYIAEVTARAKSQSPMEVVTLLSPSEYRLATREAMALAEWLKRFAEGRFGGKTSGTNNG